MRFPPPFLLAVLFTIGQDHLQPPRPRLHNPVDYVAWINGTYGGSIKVNAADKYRAAFDAYVAPSMEASEQEWAQGLQRSDEGGPSNAAAWILANKRSLQLFREATEIRDCFFPRRHPESGQLSDVLFPDLAHEVIMTRLLYEKARGQLDSGDVDGAVEDLILVMRAARHLDALPSMFEWIASRTSVVVVYKTLIEWLAVGDRPLNYEATLRKLMHEDMSFLVPRRRILMNKIKIMSWDVFQHMRIVDGEEKLFQTQSDLNIAVAELDRLAEPYFDLFTEEYAKARVLSEELDSRLTLDSIKDRVTRAHATPHALAIWTFVDRYGNVLDWVWKYAVVHREAMTARNAAYALLAINAHKAKHGHWPNSLAAAMPGVLAAYKEDPFSGKDLVYRPDEGKPVLYSVGLDGKDDGGKLTPKSWSETGDEVFLPGLKH